MSSPGDLQIMYQWAFLKPIVFKAMTKKHSFTANNRVGSGLKCKIRRNRCNSIDRILRMSRNVNRSDRT
jgi:hypothetical protein